MRITNKMIESKVNTINNLLGRPEKEYVSIDGKYVSQIGHIFVDGYNNVCEITNDSGGLRVLHYTATKKEAFLFLAGMCQSIQLQKEQK